MSERLRGLRNGVTVLSEDAIERLDQATKHVLHKVGVLFEEPVSRALLEKAGATVNGERVMFPPGMIRAALDAAPYNVVLGARAPSKAIVLGKEQMLTTNGFGASRILDGTTGTYRDATAMDARDLTRIADALDNVDYCQHQVIAQDIPPTASDVAQAYIALSNTDKHCHLSTYDNKSLDQVIALGEAVSDRENSQDAPAYSLGCCPVSPLRYPADTTFRLRVSAEKGIPFLIVVGAVCGVMAPVTLAGALVVQNAEVLAGLVLAQTVRTGAPVVYGSFTAPMNPASGQLALGVPELPLINAATAQLCRHYRIPFGYGTGGITDSHVSGFQAGMEKAMTASLAAVAGVEVIHDAVSGILASGTVVSYEQMILDDELCSIIRRYLRGIEVSDETLALNLIEDIGPGGSFISSMHTVKHLRQELCLSRLWSRGEDSQQGEREMLEKAAARVQEILSTHQPVPVSAHQAEKMRTIWESAGLDAALGSAVGPVSVA